MPRGIYLDARILGPKKLAQKMSELIRDKKKYYDYFKWHNHYVYHNTRHKPDTNEFCNLCVLINDFIRRTSRSAYQDLAKWWNENPNGEVTNGSITKRKPTYDPTFGDIISLTLKYISKSVKNNTNALLNLISETVKQALDLQKVGNKTQHFFPHGM